MVGNAAYTDRPLRNPVNDARLMQATLRELGFEVQVATDVDRRGLLGALRDFEARARGAEVVLFFFAGHGAQVGGANYLIPLNATLRSETDVPDEAVDASSVLRRIEDGRARVGLVILDACRDNPYPGANRSTARGLARMSVPTGTIVAYATAPGSTAEDGSGDNGTYTAALARHLATPGLDIKEVFDRTAQEVERLTNGKQRPREEIGLRGRFVLREGVSAVAAAPATALPSATAAPPAADPEDEAWELAKRRDNAAAFEGYLRAYPRGRFVEAARVALDGLRAQGALQPIQASSSASISPAPGVASTQALQPAQTHATPLSDDIAASVRWVQEQPPSGWLVQHGIDSDVGRLLELRRNFPRLSESRVLALVRADGRLYYALVSGPFDSADGARNFIKDGTDIPSLPWVRSIASLARELDERRSRWAASNWNVSSTVAAAPTMSSSSAIAATSSAVDPEAEAWELAKQLDSVEALEVYLSAYPRGRFVEAARVAIDGLRAQGSALDVTADVAANHGGEGETNRAQHAREQVAREARERAQREVAAKAESDARAAREKAERDARAAREKAAAAKAESEQAARDKAAREREARQKAAAEKAAAQKEAADRAAKAAADRAERERIEREKAEKAAADKAAADKAARDKREAERLARERERLEREKQETERQQKEREERERQDRQRLQREKEEQERLELQRAEREKAAPSEPEPSLTPKPNGAARTDEAETVTILRPLRFEELPVSVLRLIPVLRIDAVVKSPSPANRLLLVNGQVLREKETLVPGLRLETIGDEGVIFDWRGQRFRVVYPGSGSAGAAYSVTGDKLEADWLTKERERLTREREKSDLYQREREERERQRTEMANTLSPVNPAPALSPPAARERVSAPLPPEPTNSPPRAAEEPEPRLKVEEAIRVARDRDEALRAFSERQAPPGLHAGANTSSRPQSSAFSTTPSDTYAGLLIAAVRSNIVFTERLAGNPAAEVEVVAAHDGQITHRRITKSSGRRDWDEAVMRAIDRTRELPKDIDGRVPPKILIVFRPND